MKKTLILIPLLALLLMPATSHAELKDIMRDGLVGAGAGAVGSQCDNALVGGLAGGGTAIVGGAVLDHMMGKEESPKETRVVERETVYVDRQPEVVYVDRTPSHYVEYESDPRDYRKNEPKGKAVGYWRKQWEKDAYEQGKRDGFGEGYRTAMKNVIQYCESKL